MTRHRETLPLLRSVSSAAQWLFFVAPCKEIDGTFCEGDPDGNSYCWRHARMNEIAARIVRHNLRAK